MRENFCAPRTMENVKKNYLDARVGVNDGGVALEHGNSTMQDEENGRNDEFGDEVLKIKGYLLKE